MSLSPQPSSGPSFLMPQKQYWILLFAIRRALDSDVLASADCACAALQRSWLALSPVQREQLTEEIRRAIAAPYTDAPVANHFADRLKVIEAGVNLGGECEPSLPILTLAFRYALGRTSTAPSIVAGELAGRWSQMPGEFKKMVCDAIRSADSAGGIGHNCDRQTWFSLVALQRPAGEF